MTHCTNKKTTPIEARQRELDKKHLDEKSLKNRVFTLLVIVELRSSLTLFYGELAQGRSLGIEFDGILAAKIKVDHRDEKGTKTENGGTERTITIHEEGGVDEPDTGMWII